MKIGVFDSGVGGLSFVAKLQERYPLAQIIYKEDGKNLPYGDKSSDELLRLTLPIFREFEDGECDVVLVACNTVTTTIISKLRAELSIPLVGVEPMIKPASIMTKTKNIAVCATKATLASDRYRSLKNEFAEGINVYEPDCNNWAFMIENNRQDELNLSEMINLLKHNNVDVIVLGCTHYHWIEREIRELAGPSIKVIQPIEPVLNRLQQIIQS